MGVYIYLIYRHIDSQTPQNDNCGCVFKIKIQQCSSLFTARSHWYNSVARVHIEYKESTQRVQREYTEYKIKESKKRVQSEYIELYLSQKKLIFHKTLHFTKEAFDSTIFYEKSNSKWQI